MAGLVSYWVAVNTKGNNGFDAIFPGLTMVAFIVLGVLLSLFILVDVVTSKVFKKKK